MRPETRQSLADARAAIQEARRLAVDGWQLDRTVALAIERLLMIVGEAFVRVRATEPDVLNGIADAHKIIAMRNVLVHGYDAIDPARIRSAIEESSPKLLAEIDALIGDRV